MGQDSTSEIPRIVDSQGNFIGDVGSIERRGSGSGHASGGSLSVIREHTTALSDENLSAIHERIIEGEENV